MDGFLHLQITICKFGNIRIMDALFIIKYEFHSVWSVNFELFDSFSAPSSMYGCVCVWLDVGCGWFHQNNILIRPFVLQIPGLFWQYRREFSRTANASIEFLYVGHMAGTHSNREAQCCVIQHVRGLISMWNIHAVTDFCNQPTIYAVWWCIWLIYSIGLFVCVWFPHSVRVWYE